MAQIEVDVGDAKGTRVPTAGNQINCLIKGPGKILGIESGDQSSHENYQAPTHKAYQGRMLIYLQAQGAGNIELAVESQGLETAKLVLPAK